MAVEERWQRRFPHVALDAAAASELLGRRVIQRDLLSGGLRNTNYGLHLEEPPGRAVLRLVAGRVPVPTVLQSNAAGSPPWILVEWLPGLRFDRMLSAASPADITTACFSAGKVLAAIHSFTFNSAGGLGPALEIAEPMGYPWLTGVRDFFVQDRARELVGGDLAAGVVQLIDREAPRLAEVWLQSQLVHADYQPWNLLVQREQTGWRVSAAVDWEFCFSGPPLCDQCSKKPFAHSTGAVDNYAFRSKFNAGYPWLSRSPLRSSAASLRYRR